MLLRNKLFYRTLFARSKFLFYFSILAPARPKKPRPRSLSKTEICKEDIENSKKEKTGGGGVLKNSGNFINIYKEAAANFEKIV